MVDLALDGRNKIFLKRSLILQQKILFLKLLRALYGMGNMEVSESLMRSTDDLQPQWKGDSSSVVIFSNQPYQNKTLSGNIK